MAVRMIVPRPVVTILRLEEAGEAGTFGVLLIDSQIFCFTLEPNDLLNQSNRSSIPAQQYLARRVRSIRGGYETYVIENVPGRSGIIFHPGNWSFESRGCIMLGESIGILNGKKAVKTSRRAFNGFMEILKGHEIVTVSVKESY